MYVFVLYLHMFRFITYKFFAKQIIGATLHGMLFALKLLQHLAIRQIYRSNPWDVGSNPGIDNHITCLHWPVCSASNGQPEEILLGDFHSTLCASVLNAVQVTLVCLLLNPGGCGFKATMNKE